VTGGRWRRTVDRLRGLIARRDDRDFNIEIDEHLRLLADRYTRQGLTPVEAATAARRQFGNTTRLREDRREMQTVAALESLWIDLRHAARGLRKTPAFGSAVVLTLGLGIGANTAIFSLCSAVLLKPLPYTDPDRVVTLWEQQPNGSLGTVAPANFADWRQQARSFSAVVAMASTNLVLTGGSEPARLSGGAVSWNFFSLLGVEPALGRSFLQEEDRPGRNHVVILSYATWLDRFGGRADAVGSVVILNDTPYTIVGVLPSDFEFAGKTSSAQARTMYEAWVPLGLDPQRLQRGTHPLRVFARLAPRVDLRAAQAELDVVAATLARIYPEDDKDKRIRAVPLSDWLTGDARRPLLTLLAAVGFVLAIACANVANLLLTRSAARQRETAVRLAIGAAPARVAQLLLVESALLGGLGGAFGLALASVGIRAVAVYLPADLPRAAGAPIDWRVLLFTAAISIATVLLFSLAPLVLTRRVSAWASLAQGTRIAGGSSSRLRAALVVAQVAVTLVLLVAAGLVAKSLWALVHVPPGFRPDHVLTARLTLPRAHYSDQTRVAAFQRVLFEHLRGLPGVVSTGATAYLPLSGDDNAWAFFVEGRPPLPVGVYNMAKYRAVSDGYFGAVGMPLDEGRDFAASDTRDAPRVVVINESMANAYWPGERPVGRRLMFNGPPWRTIIGIVGDVRHEALDADLKPEMYVPFAQAPNVETTPTIVVHTAIDPAAMASTLRAAVVMADPAIPVDRVRTLDEFLSASVGQPRFRTWLLAALSMLALVMASIGLYGVTNDAVVQRTREFGIRLAVGATAGQVIRVVLGHAAWLLLTGLAIGLAASAALTRTMARLLFGVAPLDGQTFAAVSMLLIAVGCLASYIPARRAARIDPTVALRSE
jgi:putative ABC transport system permease protein